MNGVPVLRARSAYSWLTGPCPPARLVEGLGVVAGPRPRPVALCDRDGVWGLVEFLRASDVGGVRPIPGVEVTDPRGGGPLGGNSAWVLVRSERGWRNLCSLVTRRHLDGRFDLARAVARRQEGCLVLVEDPRTLPTWSAYVEPRRLRAAIDPLRAGSAATRTLREAASALGVEAVAAPLVQGFEDRDAAVHRLMLAARDGQLVEGLDPARHAGGVGAPAGTASRAGLLPTADEAKRLFTDAERQATREAARLCAWTPELDRPRLPECRLEPGESALSKLCDLATRGAQRRYRGVTPEVLGRLQSELRVIEQLGMAAYFLIVHEIAEAAKERGIPCVGRGSAGCSIVAYTLGLTDVCPIRYRLPFERFLNEKRGDYPDIDLDFCWRRRDEVLEWALERFGEERCAMVSTIQTFGPRQAFREAAKAFGMPPGRVDTLARKLPYHHRDSGPVRPEAFDGLRDAEVAAEIPDAVVMGAKALAGLPRHAGLHLGGIVVAPGAMDDVLPRHRAAKGLVSVQADKRGVEALGLVKFDILGNRALTTVVETLAHIEAAGAEVPDLETLTDDDDRTRRLVTAGQTIGVFQIESPGMRALLRSLEAGDRDTTIQGVALIRPGASGSGMKDRFLRRQHGEDNWVPPHPLVEEALGGTHGVMLYQEDLIWTAHHVGGMDLADGDRVRKSVGVPGPELDELHARFLAGAAERGVPDATAAALWEGMLSFGSFAYCKAHAVVYGRLAWRCAWLKAHHPGPFLAAFLASETGYYAPAVYIAEARRLGVGILAPDINRSGATFSWEPGEGGDDVARGSISVGLGQVRGMRAETTARILEERGAGGPFLSLRDFLARTGPKRAEAEQLVLAGACDDFERTRPEMMMRLALLEPGEGPSAPAQTPRAHLVPAIPEYDAKTGETYQAEAVGFPITRGLFALGRMGSEEEDARALPCADLGDHVGRTVTVRGWAVATRLWRTRKARRRMRFLSLEDESGVCEVILHAAAIARGGDPFHGPDAYEATGVVEQRHGALTLRASRLVALGASPWG